MWRWIEEIIRNIKIKIINIINTLVCKRKIKLDKKIKWINYIEKEYFIRYENYLIISIISFNNWEIKGQGKNKIIIISKSLKR